MKYLLSLFLFGLVAYHSNAQTVIAAKDAKAHLSENVTVTDKVFGGKLLPSNMTLIDLGGSYPNQLLTIMIPPSAREKFEGKPEADWKGKTVIVTGKVINYNGKPEIIIENPAAIAVH